MQSLLKTIAIALAVPQFVLIAQVPEEPAGFSLGRLVGYCLVANCRIFRGSLLTDSPNRGQRVKVRVEEGIFGAEDGAETIDLPYADPKEIVKSYDGLHEAWRVGGGVSFS